MINLFYIRDCFYLLLKQKVNSRSYSKCVKKSHEIAFVLSEVIVAEMVRQITPFKRE